MSLYKNHPTVDDIKVRIGMTPGGRPYVAMKKPTSSGMEFYVRVWAAVDGDKSWSKDKLFGKQVQSSDVATLYRVSSGPTKKVKKRGKIEDHRHYWFRPETLK